MNLSLYKHKFYCTDPRRRKLDLKEEIYFYEKELVTQSKMNLLLKIFCANIKHEAIYNSLFIDKSLLKMPRFEGFGWVG